MSGSDESLETAYSRLSLSSYVEMLEQQQVQLVNGLHELYKQVITGQSWEGPLLSDSGNGRPLTHDILNSLGVLHAENQSTSGGFEDDLDTMQQRLLSDSLDFSHRRDSPDSENERNSMNSSFFESAPRQSFSKDAFSIAPLSTPPIAQIPFITPTWQASNKSTPIRPQSLHIHPGYSTSQANLSSTSLNQQSCFDSPMTYDEGVELLRFNNFMNFENAGGLQQCSTPMETGIQTSAIANWNEEDFTNFLNTSLS